MMMQDRIARIGLSSALVVAASELENGRIVNFGGGEDRQNIEVWPHGGAFQIKTCGRAYDVSGWDFSAAETVAIAYSVWAKKTTLAKMVRAGSITIAL